MLGPLGILLFGVETLGVWGPEDQIDVGILHSGSKPETRRVPEPWS